MKIKIILTIILLIVTVALAGVAIFTSFNKKTDGINSFEKCQAAGYQILETFPAQCKTPEGKTFKQVINPPKADFNTPVSLSPGKRTTFADGLRVALVGLNDSRCPKTAVCVWAGEITAQFNILGGKIAEEKEFRLGTVNVKSTNTGDYTFILNDANLKTATFMVTEGDTIPTETSSPNNAEAGGTVQPEPVCFVGGCNNEICSSQKSIASTCAYRQEFACYESAKCEKQQNGQCGWTQTKELKTCINKAVSSGQGLAQ